MRRCCRMGRPNLKNLRADASYPHKRWCDGDSAVLLSGHEDAQRTGVVIRAGGRRRVYLALVQSITQAAKRQMTISSPSTDLEHAEIPDREVVISELGGALLSSSAIVI